MLDSYVAKCGAFVTVNLQLRRNFTVGTHNGLFSIGKGGPVSGTNLGSSHQMLREDPRSALSLRAWENLECLKIQAALESI